MGKYINDNWLRQTKTSNDSDFEDDVTDSDHMDKLTNILQDHGIETKVNKKLRERRISEWLLAL
jgi:hypothetical protein